MSPRVAGREGAKPGAQVLQSGLPWEATATYSRPGGQTRMEHQQKPDRLKDGHSYHESRPDNWPQRNYRPKETLADLSQDMASALIHCATQGAHPDEFGTADEVKDKDSKARWLNTTRDALVRHGLVHKMKNRKGRELWRATDIGRGVAGAHVPRFLMPASRPRRVVGDEHDPSARGYTPIPGFGMKGEPEAA